MPDSISERLSAIAAVVMTLLFATTSAADFNVELIVYAQLQPAAANEQWSMPQSLPATDRALLIGEQGSRMLDGPRSMQAIADTIRRSKQYRALLHWNWQQSANTAAQAQAMLIQIPADASLPITELPEHLSRLAMHSLLPSADSLASMQIQTTPLLNGTLKLIVDSIMQVDVDLLYRDASIAVPIQLKESRRLRSGELHYLDHSRFGVIVRVTQVGEAQN